MLKEIDVYLVKVKWDVYKRQELFRPKNTSGRSERQMVVYYNVLNILGDRMVKDQAATITLVGSSEKSPEDGRAMAESIRDYLVNVFGITSSRINIDCLLYTSRCV